MEGGGEGQGEGEMKGGRENLRLEIFILIKNIVLTYMQLHFWHQTLQLYVIIALKRH